MSLLIRFSEDWSMHRLIFFFETDNSIPLFDKIFRMLGTLCNI